jgi:hypothetical protein
MSSNRARRRITERAYRWRLRNRIVEKYGSRCSRCGFTDQRTLQIDHVHGGGSQQRAATNYVARSLEILRDTEGNFQLLCANCNWIKRYEREEWPLHETTSEGDTNG